MKVTARMFCGALCADGDGSVLLLLSVSGEMKMELVYSPSRKRLNVARRILSLRLISDLFGAGCGRARGRSSYIDDETARTRHTATLTPSHRRIKCLSNRRGLAIPGRLTRAESRQYLYA